MASGIIEIMKKAALDAYDAKQPCDLRYGTVVSASPIKVQVSHQFTIPTSMLIVPKRLTDFDVECTIDGEDKTIKIKNALKAGDKVVLVRQQGGQSYLIVDRI